MRFNYTHEDTGRQGEWVTYWDTGHPYMSVHFVDNKMDGTFRSWYPDGGQRTVAQMVHGERDGLYRSWYPNGQLEEEARYVKNLRCGVSYMWHMDGRVSGKELYEGGKLVKLWTRRMNGWVMHVPRMAEEEEDVEEG
jgi:antitoxin component YwqK of YwqJK toxin-antitoxin module